MRTALKLACAGVLAVLAGCSSLSALNPFGDKAEARNSPAELIEIKQAMAIRAVWSASVGRAGSNVFSPAAAGNSVFAAAADGTVTRLDLATGRAIWRINADLRLTAGVGSDGTLVAVAGEKGTILAFDADGKQRWKAQASSEVLSTPVVAQGLVIVRSVDNRIAAYDANSGARRWTLQRSVPPLTLRSAPGIAVAGGNAYVGLPGGKLLALALNNGGPRWEAVVGDPRGATELERIADISGMPLVLEREVCAIAYQGRVACFDAVSGTTIWAKNLSSEVGLGGDLRFVFAADDSGAVNAFARESGASVWRNKQLANRRLSTPLSFGRTVAVGDYQGHIHFLSREDGAMLGRISTDGSPVIGTPLVAGSFGIFQTQAGTLVALGTE